MEIRKSRKYSISKNENKEKIIVGYAIKWDSWSQPLHTGQKNYYFRERILKGAFTESLLEGGQEALVEHDTGAFLGSVGDGSLYFVEDDIGLAFGLILPEKTFGDLIYDRVESESLPHVSVAFETIKDEWEDDDVMLYRTVKKAKLIEISLCSEPAYLDTVATIA